MFKYLSYKLYIGILAKLNPSTTILNCNLLKGKDCTIVKLTEANLVDRQ